MARLDGAGWRTARDHLSSRSPVRTGHAGASHAVRVMFRTWRAERGGAITRCGVSSPRAYWHVMRSREREGEGGDVEADFSSAGEPSGPGVSPGMGIDPADVRIGWVACAGPWSGDAHASRISAVARTHLSSGVGLVMSLRSVASRPGAGRPGALPGRTAGTGCAGSRCTGCGVRSGCG
jgi:hypothetical protein